MTRSSSHNGFHNNSPNSSDNRNRPTCFKCGEQGHMRINCKEEFSVHIAGLQTTTPKHAGNTTTVPQAPQTAMSQQDTTPQQHHHHYWEQQQLDHKHNKQVQPTTDHCSRTYLTPTNLEPVPPCTHHSTAHPQHHQPT